jgi:hypothetical protein
MAGAAPAKAGQWQVRFAFRVLSIRFAFCVRVRTDGPLMSLCTVFWRAKMGRSDPAHSVSFCGSRLEDIKADPLTIDLSRASQEHQSRDS